MRIKRNSSKQVGGDIIANKKTFLLIKALEKAKGKEKIELEKWLTSKKFSKPKKVKAVTAIYDSLHLSTLIEEKAKYFFEKGLACLSNLSNPREVNHLKGFVEKLISREA